MEPHIRIDQTATNTSPNISTGRSTRNRPNATELYQSLPSTLQQTNTNIGRKSNKNQPSTHWVQVHVVSAMVIWVLLYGVAWWLIVAQSCGGFRYQTVPDCC